MKIGSLEITPTKLRDGNYHSTVEGRTYILLTLGLWTVVDLRHAAIVLMFRWQAMRNHGEGNPDNNTYYAITTCVINGKRTSIRLHVLIKLLEDEVKSTRKNNINHLDDCGLNNLCENLEFSTAGDNNTYEAPVKVHRFLIALPDSVRFALFPLQEAA